MRRAWVPTCRCAWPAGPPWCRASASACNPRRRCRAAPVLLVNPGVALATREVFEARRGAFSTPAPVTRPWQDLSSFVAALAERGNDLSEAAISLRPVIAEVLAFLRRSDGVRYAAMSGSGATCFALYDSADAAQRASASMPPAWWRHAGTFIASR